LRKPDKDVRAFFQSNFWIEKDAKHQTAITRNLNLVNAFDLSHFAEPRNKIKIIKSFDQLMENLLKTAPMFYRTNSGFSRGE